MRAFPYRPIAAGVTLLLAVALGAAMRPDPQQDGVVRARPPAARLVLTEVLRLGSESGANDAFGRVMDVELSASGRIYAVDDRNANVWVYDRSGRLLRRVGRKGGGPGEFERPWYVAVDRNDSLFVWDPGRGRISVFGPDFRYARAFNAPGGWVVGGFSVRADGTLLVGAYDDARAGPIHVLARDGRLLRSFGPAANATGIPVGFTASLLGGSAEESDEGIVYSRRSPYELVFHDRAGRRLRSCRGDARWTTPTRGAVREVGRQQSLDWQRFVHSVGAIPLGGGYYLNQVLDPGGETTTLDLVRADCGLANRRVHDGVLLFQARRGDLLLAHAQGDFSQVVLYRYRVERSAR